MTSEMTWNPQTEKNVMFLNKGVHGEMAEEQRNDHVVFGP